MNRIADAFNNKKAFIAFITGGDPDIDTTERLIVAMAESGVDLVEIGIPFSDPIAEGVVIQKASERALKAGCTVDKLFDMVARVRGKVAIPIVFMTYINPIFVYGKERFMQKAADCGIDGVIVPDMPFEEADELATVCTKYDVRLISMIAPTSEARIDAIAREAEGFLYCVSSLGVTGVRSEFNANLGAMIARVKSVSDIPCAIGFGVSTPEQARDMARIADGVIIGSAIVKIIAQFGTECVEHVTEFTSSVKRAIG